MEHYGEKKVRCEFDGLSLLVSMKFQVSDARNPLVSVARVMERGNMVHFGPTDEDNYIFCFTNGLAQASSGRSRLSHSRLERAKASTASELGVAGREPMCTQGRTTK